MRHDGDAADVVAIGDVGHGQAVDIVAARGEQAGDLGENARFVVDRDGEDVALLRLLSDVHHCSGVPQTSALASSSIVPATSSP
ncbi:hypothetical protein [Novosphingobium sp. ES2-1]|uniref:hypothetical protein n=1 Tax=Novosphingobium sp. ES2-1 TaxID=2780074 RepID=UPI00351C2647